MSTGAADGRGSGRVPFEVGVASTVFALLLALAVIWPRPVLWINDLTFQADLSISRISFLGREAPSWDVVYWMIAGFATLALFHGRLGEAKATWVVVRQDLSGSASQTAGRLRGLRRTSTLVVMFALVAACCATWLFVDGPLLAQASTVGSAHVLDVVRLFNRLGGGGNPPMVAGFFVLAGLALGRPRWTLLGFAMLTSAAIGGLIASVLKLLVGRTRPEQWLGPFSRAWGGESSFPSGHSIAAFAIAGAVLAGSRSPVLRVTFLVAATSIAAARIIALRHWPSDVLFSSLLGALLGWFVGCVFVGRTDDSGVEVGEVDRDES